jgi:H+/Cl- antiporter ClcA
VKIPSWRKVVRGAGVKSDLTEIRTLFLRYLKEETLQPLKELGRFVLFGAIGSVFVGFGLTMLLLGGLRFLQDEFRVLDGSLSWLPYVIVVLLAALVMGLTLWRIVAGAAKRRLKTAE